MITCISPFLISRLMPFSIFLPSTSACRFLIVSMILFLYCFFLYKCCDILPYTTFQCDRQQFLRFYGKLHRELVQHFFRVAINNKGHCFFCFYTTLVQVKYLVFPDLGSSSLVFNGSSTVP